MVKWDIMLISGKIYNPKSDNKEEKMDEKKKPLGVYLARILLIPAAAGFLTLFVINFALTVSALVLLSAGLLCLPVGLLDLTKIIKVLKVASDLSPVALAAFGAFMLCAGVFLAFFLCIFSPFSVRLLYRYIAAVKNERWRRIYSNFSFLRLLVISLVFSFLSLGAFIELYRIDTERGYQGTVIKESLEFPVAKYLYISTSGLDYELKSYDGEKILVEYTNDMPIIVEESSEDYLKLTQDDSFTLSLFARDQFSYKMTVWLPLNDYREFHLSSGSGSITLEETPSRYTRLRTRSGSIYVNNGDKEINAATISGSIFCSYCNFAATGSFESGKGDIEVCMPEKSGVELRFRTDSGWLDGGLMGLDERFYGSLDMQKPSDLSNYLYVTTVSGGLILDALKEP